MGCPALKVRFSGATSSGLFLSKGKTPTLMGAMRGWKRMIVRTSTFPFTSAFSSSQNEFARMASASRSRPADGSMTCGTYRSLVWSSKYFRSLPLPLWRGLPSAPVSTSVLRSPSCNIRTVANTKTTNAMPAAVSAVVNFRVRKFLAVYANGMAIES